MHMESKLDLTHRGTFQMLPSISLAGPQSKKIGKVLLLDGYSTRTLACVRSWGKKGIAFAVGGETRWDMSLFSRYSKETFVYTSPKRDLLKFIQDVNRFCHKFGADSVFPTSEASIIACCKYRNELACHPIIPRECEIEAIFDKTNTLRLARSLGITIPKTLHISEGNRHLLSRISMNFPIVIKSSSSQVLLKSRIATSEKTAYAFSKMELESECRSRLARGQSLLLQEFIDGYGVGISGLFAGGRPVALVAHRRVRESNPLGGPSALAETVEIDPHLLEATTALFETIEFTGPAMVEFKVDRRSGRHYLMEINGRLWGTILLALASGLDLPYLYWKMLNGMDILREEKGYQVGLRGRYLAGDTKSLLLCLKGKPRHWPGPFASRWSAIRSYVSSFFDRQTIDLIFTQDDPKPFLARLLQDLK